MSRTFTIFALAGSLSLAMMLPAFATPTPAGFNTLLCLADALLDGAASIPGDTPISLFGGQVAIVPLVSIVAADGISTIDVRVTHGGDSNDHRVTFVDNAGPVGALNCGDTIVLVSPLSSDGSPFFRSD